MPYLSFNELVPNGHVTVTEDGLLYAVELVMLFTKKNRGDSAKVLRDLPEDKFNGGKILIKSFNGKGNGRTKLVSFKDAIELIMVLPGAVATEYRQKFSGVIQAYIAGDSKLVGQIEANALSNNPINRMARESMASESAQLPDEAEVGQKRLRDATEVCNLSLATRNNFQAAVTAAREVAQLTDRVVQLTDQDCTRKEQHGETMYKQLCREHDAKLQHERAMLDLARERAALAAGLAPSVAAPAAAPAAAVVLGRVPAGHTTVWKVYQKNKPAFALLNARQMEQALRYAGSEARGAYVARHGADPAQARERQFSVYCYPEAFESELLAVLHRSARRVLGVATITTYVAVAVPAAGN